MKVLGCHREGAKGKELSQGLAAGYNFLPSVGALTGNFKQLRQLPAQLLHSDVCDGAQDHHWPLEAGYGRTDVLRMAGGKGRAPSTQAYSSWHPQACNSPCSFQERGPISIHRGQSQDQYPQGESGCPSAHLP